MTERLHFYFDAYKNYSKMLRGCRIVATMYADSWRGINMIYSYLMEQAQA